MKRIVSLVRDSWIPLDFYQRHPDGVEIRTNGWRLSWGGQRPPPAYLGIDAIGDCSGAESNGCDPGNQDRAKPA